MSNAKPTKPRRTIRCSDLARLAFCNSANLPHLVECDGKRLRWAGIGWVREGRPKGREILVID